VTERFGKDRGGGPIRQERASKHPDYGAGGVDGAVGWLRCRKMGRRIEQRAYHCGKQTAIRRGALFTTGPKRSGRSLINQRLAREALRRKEPGDVGDPSPPGLPRRHRRSRTKSKRTGSEKVEAYF
jgi:hypothetical protein